MKILAISDYIVEQVYDIPYEDNFQGIDLILSCGDLPPEYLSGLSGLFKAPLYYVKGNHDIRYQNRPPDGCIDINGRPIRFQEKIIVGIQGSHWYNGGPFQYTEKEMGAFVRRLWFKFWLRQKPDVVISHAPPRFVHDAEDQCHRGFMAFHRLIKQYSPRYFIHGHIHAHFHTPLERITMVGQTQVVNTCGYCLLEHV